MSNASHLEFYIQNGISPVHYVTGNLGEQFQRRASLYRSLGLLPLAVRGSRVLEVAVGSGQNSLYLSSLHGVLGCMKYFPAEIRHSVESGLRLLETRGDYGLLGVDSPFSRLFGRENIYLSMIADKVA